MRIAAKQPKSKLILIYLKKFAENFQYNYKQKEKSKINE